MGWPDLSREQQGAALAKAADVRRARTELLASVTSQQLSLAEVLERDDVVVKRTRVVAVLRAVPGFGPATVVALMAVCGVKQKCRVGELEERQRRRLPDTFAR
jgi:hypothetical protein